MPVLALSVQSRVPHPGADSLDIYTFTARNLGAFQVVGNRDLVHEPGDVVAVALVGTELLDGTKVRRAKLRGVASEGLRLEAVDVPEGTDLSERFAKPPEAPLEDAPSAPHIKWTKTHSFPTVRVEALAAAEYDPGRPVVVTYRGKVKLHGTNAGVQIHPDGTVVPQGRNRTLSLQDPNAGFATWVLQHRAMFAALAGDALVVLYGEWAGPGIQKGTALGKLRRKIFAVFAAQIGDHQRVESTLVTCPERLATMVPDHEDVFVLPWYGTARVFDLTDKPALEARMQEVADEVSAVEAEDPWVRDTFGERGTGEGLVYFPVPVADGPFDAQPREHVTALLFKAKGDKHKVVKGPRAAVDPLKVASVQAFVDAFVTEARLEQGVAEVFGDEPLTPRSIGPFLKWLGGDVRSESEAERAASGLEWKDVGKAVGNRGKIWLLGRMR